MSPSRGSAGRCLPLIARDQSLKTGQSFIDATVGTKQLKTRWIGLTSSFRSSFLTRKRSPKPVWAGSRRSVVRFSQKPLAVPAFTMQNGRASS
jgi:hypothetical protein